MNGIVAILILLQAKPEPTRVQEIHEKSNEMKDRSVMIEGQVTVLDASAKGDTRFFEVRDDYGGTIWVRTMKPLPTVGQRYRIRGVVSIEGDRSSPRFRQAYIHEDSREDVQPKPDFTLILLVAGAGLVFIVLVVLLITNLRRGKAAPAPAPLDVIVDTSPAPQGVPVNGHTVKMVVPPPGTMQLLKGRFELPNDDKVKELRMYAKEVMIAGDRGQVLAGADQYRIILLKSPGVSSKQAKLIHDGAGWRVVNYADDSKNPTRVDGMPLRVEESKPLVDGSEIEFADVKVVYRAN